MKLILSTSLDPFFYILVETIVDALAVVITIRVGFFYIAA